jgi:DNA-binding NarL/FixJ family response regulator
MPDQLRVGIVEDHPQFRPDLVTLVSGAGDMRVVGDFAAAEEALAKLPGLDPQVVLMDIHLPGISGIECVARLRTRLPQVHVVMLTAFDDALSIFESLKAGASGYLLKRAPAAQILGAIRDVAAGGAPMTGSVARLVVRFFNDRAPSASADLLSGRERAVAVALGEGQRYKEVAESLGISINTVRKHIRSIYDKLQVHSKVEMLAKLGLTV